MLRWHLVPIAAKHVARRRNMSATPDKETVDILLMQEEDQPLFKICYQCGTCTGTCPWNLVRSFTVRKIMHKAQLGLNIVTSIICMMACVVLTGYGVKVTWDLYVSKAFTYTILEVPKFLIIWVIFFGSFLLFIQFVMKFMGYIKAWRQSDSG